MFRLRLTLAFTHSLTQLETHKGVFSIIFFLCSVIVLKTYLLSGASCCPMPSFFSFNIYFINNMTLCKNKVDALSTILCDYHLFAFVCGISLFFALYLVRNCYHHHHDRTPQRQRNTNRGEREKKNLF